jgi:hypothetical protein
MSAEEWKCSVKEAVFLTAQRYQFFLSDDIWRLLAGEYETKDQAVLGLVLQEAEEETWIESAVPDIFSETPAPFQAHSATSHAAAESIELNAGTLRLKVYDFLLEQGPIGATDEEIGECLDMRGNTVRPRRRELQVANHVIDSGLRRLTRSGRSAVVWKASLVPYRWHSLIFGEPDLL